MSKLTKYEKETIVLFNEGEDTAHIQTYNAGLRKRLETFSKKHPDLCQLDKTYGQGGVSYTLDKSRLSIRLQPPYSEERRQKASANAKQNGFNNKMIKENMTMKANEMRTLFTFGCPNREATVERLCYAAALAVDPMAKKLMMELANRLDSELSDEQYRNFFYLMRADAEYPTLRQYKRDYNRQSVAERLDKISHQERYNGRYRSRKGFSDQTE